MSLGTTTIQSHGEVDTLPRETYGTGEPILRIGNGGAGDQHHSKAETTHTNSPNTGATGLIRALAEDYISTFDVSGSIQWICNHSRNTQLALLHNHIDIALTYERDQEALAESEGWPRTVGCAFHDHFCLAGPANDPADISSTTSIAKALTRIAKTKSLFHSRADSSATMWKERGLWAATEIHPWEATNDKTSSWYKMSVFSPSEAIIAADAASAYLLTDRSTLLRQVALQTISNTTVFFEPHGPEDILMNSCYASVPAKPTTDRQQAETARFAEYLNSPRGQNIVVRFGEDDLGGYGLFASRETGFVKTFLRGGIPRAGKWILNT